MKNHRSILSLALIFAFAAPAMFSSSLPGCKKKNEPQPDSGIFRSDDAGVTWTQKNVIEGKKILPKVDTANLFFDQENSKVIYLTTRGSGIFVSKNRGESWQGANINSGNIYKIVFHPENKEIIYIVGYIDNKGTVAKSADNGQTWQSIYDDPIPTPSAVFDLVIDNYNPQIFYIGTGWGGILKSEDEGASWKRILEIGEKTQKIIMSEKDSQALVVTTMNNGIFKTFNGGESWINLKLNIENKNQPASSQINDETEPAENLEKIPVSRINDFYWAENRDRFYISAPEGLFYSDDQGSTWQDLETLPPKGTMEILTFAINPENENEIIYASPTAVFKSENLGESWLPKKVMAKNFVRMIKYDPNDPNIVYLGTRLGN